MDGEAQQKPPHLFTTVQWIAWAGSLAVATGATTKWSFETFQTKREAENARLELTKRQEGDRKEVLDELRILRADILKIVQRQANRIKGEGDQYGNQEAVAVQDRVGVADRRPRSVRPGS